jgi:hypothetical protein
VGSPINVEDTPTSPSRIALSHDAAHDSLRPKSTECPEMSPWSSQSHGLRAPGGPQPGEGLSVPRYGKQPQPYSCVDESLWDNLDFILDGFHI